MAIDGATRILGLVGESIEYTMSPAMHNRAAAKLGVNAVYLPFSLPEAKIASFLDLMWGLGAVGFNVTQPHKGAVAKLVPGSGLGSVNTLFRGEHGWTAASTDGEGFARGLLRTGRELGSFAEIVMLGSGGAAQAIVEHLATASLQPKLTTLRRAELQDATALTTALAGKGEETLLIQATSAPLKGDDLSSLTPALRDFRGVVCDLVYGKPSALYFAAVGKDLVAQDGEPMLIEQARLAQKLWWGKAAAYDEMAAALRGKTLV